MGAMKRCVIICGGDCTAEIISQNVSHKDYIICADSGYDCLKNTDFTCDLIIGDFDSLNSPLPKGIEHISLPVEKDVTDSDFAVDEAIRRGFSDILLLGATGGRLEHTYANLLLISRCAERGVHAKIIDSRHTVQCVKNSELTVKGKENQQISIFAVGKTAKGVSLSGFHYTVTDYSLTALDSLGISNDIVEGFGVISVKDGTLMVIETKML